MVIDKLILVVDEVNLLVHRFSLVSIFFSDGFAVCCSTPFKTAVIYFRKGKVATEIIKEQRNLFFNDFEHWFVLELTL